MCSSSYTRNCLYPSSICCSSWSIRRRPCASAPPPPLHRGQLHPQGLDAAARAAVVRDGAVHQARLFHLLAAPQLRNCDALVIDVSDATHVHGVDMRARRLADLQGAKEEAP